MRLAILTLIAALSVTAAEKVVGGPYVVNSSVRSATIAWIVATGEVSVQAPGGTAALTSPTLRVEKTTLSGLKPNTKYEYSVGRDAALKGCFKTPPTGDEPFRFVVYGDNRTRHDIHRRVVDTLMKRGVPDFVLQTGDLVADGYNDALWPVFFDIEKELLRQTSFFPALGNHERNTPRFLEFFQTAKPYYSFDWGKAHFIVLNSDLPNVSHSERERAAFWAEQTRWLEDDLATHQSAQYRFISAHHPPFTAVERRQGDNAHMTALVPMFEKYRVTAAFFGHDHNYQHYLKNGIHYVISGGGGAPLYDVNSPPANITQRVVSSENFVSVSVDGKNIHVEAISMNGDVLDSFELTPPR